MKKSKIFLLSLVLAFTFFSAAQALQWPNPPFEGSHEFPELVGFVEWLTTGAIGDNTYDSNTDLFSPFAGSLGGIYEVTGLGWEAAYTNHFGTDSLGDLITGNDPSTFGLIYDVDFANDKVYFSDPEHASTAYFTDASHAQVEIWVLDVAVNIDYLPGLSSYYLPKGTIIAGFNDSFTDDNHDDLIVSLKASPVPEPATLLLFGTGLIGIAGFGRKKLKK